MKNTLPAEVAAVFRGALTCEVTTMARRDDTPVTIPMTAHWREDAGQFVLSTGVVVRGKLDRLHRDPRISLCFSEFTGSGLSDPPSVLVQGRATIADKLFGAEGLEDFWLDLMKKKPSFQDFVLATETRDIPAQQKTWWRTRITVEPTKMWVVRGAAGEQELERIL